jgi:hypothetical protein
MNTELLAVNKVSDMISRCSHLAPRIDSNDKTPFTDGTIDIYRSPSGANKDFVGRVPVQVKGRAVQKKAKQKRWWGLPYRIDRDDLEGHLRNSGVLYFVVDIDKETGKRKVYYALLNPFKIHDMLAAMKPKQQSTSFVLKPLPRDPGQIYDIIKLAYKTRDEPKQQVTLDDDLMKNVRGFTVFTDGTVDFNKPVRLRTGEQDFSVVFTTKSGIQVPISGDWELIPEIYAGQPTDLTVSSGDITFTQPIRRKINQSTVALELSPGLSLIIEETEEGHCARFEITAHSNLGRRFKDLSFVLAVSRTSAFSINGHEQKLKDQGHDDLSEIREHFSSLETLVSVFDYLNADPYLVDLSSLDNRRTEQLSMLHHALVEGREVSQDFTEAGRVYQPVGPWGFELFCTPGKNDDRWLYYNLFDPDLPFQFRMQDEDNPTDSWRVTPYEVVDAENLSKILNLSLENVVGAYEKIGAYEETTDLANLMVLKFIDAADASEARRDEFLTAAERLNKWTLDRTQDKPDLYVNRWQIAARKGSLSQMDRDSIRELKRIATRGEIQAAGPIEAACSILLGDLEDVDFSISNLTKPELDDLQSWPIWTYHQNTNLLSEPAE